MTSPRRERRRYRWTNRILLASLIAYLLVVFETERVHGRDEVFPIASWSLFSKVPNEVKDYSLRLLVVRGKPLAEPVFFEDAAGILRNRKSHPARMSFQRLGRALAAGDAAEAARVRASVEDLHLRDAGDVTYEVVARTYDPLDRFRGAPLENVRRLATFRAGQPDAGVSP